MTDLPEPNPVADRQMYFLVCGNIVFRAAEPDAVPCTMPLNCVITSRDGRFAVQHIARTQQTLQMHFHKRMEDETLTVLDCVITSIMPLGHFTHEEFNQLPEGMTVAPAAPPEDDIESVLRANGIDVQTIGNA